jgi:hypothetical protein
MCLVFFYYHFLHYGQGKWIPRRRRLVQVPITFVIVEVLVALWRGHGNRRTGAFRTGAGGGGIIGTAKAFVAPVKIALGTGATINVAGKKSWLWRLGTAVALGCSRHCTGAVTERAKADASSGTPTRVATVVEPVRAGLATNHCRRVVLGTARRSAVRVLGTVALRAKARFGNGAAAVAASANVAAVVEAEGAGSAIDRKRRYRYDRQTGRGRFGCGRFG